MSMPTRATAAMPRRTRKDDDRRSRLIEELESIFLSAGFSGLTSKICADVFAAQTLPCIP